MNSSNVRMYSELIVNNVDFILFNHKMLQKRKNYARKRYSVHYERQFKQVFHSSD